MGICGSNLGAFVSGINKQLSQKRLRKNLANSKLKMWYSSSKKAFSHCQQLFEETALRIPNAKTYMFFTALKSSFLPVENKNKNKT